MNNNNQGTTTILFDILQSHKDLITTNYNGKKDQILIDKQLMEKLNQAASGKEIKKTIEASIKKSLKLTQSDLLFYKNGYMFIKLISEDKRRKIEEKDKETVANRYNGIDQTELEHFNEEFFAHDQHKDFFFIIAQKFVQKYFLKKTITNAEYEKYVFPYIQKVILQELVSIYDNEDGFFDGFSGYLFRHNFTLVFEHLAHLLLHEIAQSNDSVISFLNYYSSDIILLNGDKYKVPSIESQNESAWTVVSMLSIVKVYDRAHSSKKKFIKEIDLIMPQIKQLYVNNTSPIAFNDKLLKTIQKIEIKVTRKTKKLQLDSEGLKSEKNEKTRLFKQQEKDYLIKEIQSLNEERRSLSLKMVKQHILSNYIQLQRELDSYNRHLKVEENIISQNKDAYSSIRISLAKALLSKKKLLKST